MKKILHIVGSMNRAGAETMLMTLFKHINLSKFQFDFVYFTDEECDYDNEILELGGQIFRIKNNKPWNRSLFIYKVLKQNGPYWAVHSHTNHSSFMHHFAAILAGVKKRISHSHCSNSHYLNSVAGRLYLWMSRKLNFYLTNCFIACGEAAGQFLFPAVDVDKIMILPNALALDNFLYPESIGLPSLKNSLSIKESVPLIVQIGRLSQVKNFAFTIDFASYLKERGKKFHFIFIGAGELYDSLLEKVDNLGLNDCIHFLGVRDDIPQILNEANCLLMPSLHEGFPVVLVEAQAAGIPCVISDRISREVDLKLDLIQFCSLRAPFIEWEERLEEMLVTPFVSKEMRNEVISSLGFSVHDSVLRLAEIYEK